MVQEDQKWFDEVYISTAPMVRRYVLSLFRAFPWLPYDPDDIIQEVYICLYEKRNQIYDPSGLKPWLIKVAQNKTYAVGREYARKHRAIHSLDDVQEEAQAILSAMDFHPCDFQMYLRLCEQRIGKRKLEILLRHYVDEEPIQKIAREEGVATPVLRMRFQRWRRYCAQVIRSTLWADLILLISGAIHKNGVG